MGDEQRTQQEMEQEARTGLEPLGFLVGEWEGEGSSHGQPVRGRLSVREALGGTFLHAREETYGPGGERDYEDLAFYRFDLREKSLRVLHLMSPAWAVERAVQRTEKGWRWFAGPFAPRVELWLDGEDLIVEVWLPFRGEPDARMRYRRA